MVHKLSLISNPNLQYTFIELTGQLSSGNDLNGVSLPEQY